MPCEWSLRAEESPMLGFNKMLHDKLGTDG